MPDKDESMQKMKSYRYIAWGLGAFALLAVTYVLFMGPLPIRLAYLITGAVAVGVLVLAVEIAFRRMQSRA